MFLADIHFPHRSNSDGTIDSICPRCFATVGTSTWEADLERMEAAHVCNPIRLNEYEHWRKSTRMPTQCEPASDRLVAHIE